MRFDSRHCPARLAPLLFFSLVVMPFGAVHAESAEWTLDFGGGVHRLLSEDEDDTYDLGLTSLVGVSWHVGTDRTTELRADLTWRTGSGPEYATDPTFVVDDARYDSVRLAVGVREGTDFEAGRNVALRIGGGLLLNWASWRSPFGDRTNDVLPGVWAEVTPRFRVSDTWHVWLMLRMSLMSEQSLGDVFSPFDSSDFDMLAGVAHDL